MYNFTFEKANGRHQPNKRDHIGRASAAPYSWDADAPERFRSNMTVDCMVMFPASSSACKVSIDVAVPFLTILSRTIASWGAWYCVLLSANLRFHHVHFALHIPLLQIRCLHTSSPPSSLHLCPAFTRCLSLALAAPPFWWFSGCRLVLRLLSSKSDRTLSF